MILRLEWVFSFVVLSIITLSMSCGAYPSDFFPANNLGEQDQLNAGTGIDESMFGQIIRAGQDSYAKAEALQRNELLYVNRNWTDKTVNANVLRTKKYGGEVVINMYGGLARRKEITPSGFAIVLCHELGHAYAGEPFIYATTELSAEGMSDWYSTRHCLRRIWERVPELQRVSSDYEPFIDQNCVPGDSLCRNGLEGAHGLANLLAFISGADVLPAFETPDPTVVSKTVLSYPATVQCRLDSYAAGMFVDPRPVCWFKPSY